MLSKKKNKKLAKTLNKIFSDESFILDLVSDVIKSRGYRIQEVQKRFGDILTYYISTRDTKVYKYQELKDILYDEIYGCRKSVCPKNIKRNEEESEALVRNIINEGVVTHSFNGFNLSRIKNMG